jgi:small-conductance mechanosensitive channel
MSSILFALVAPDFLSTLGGNARHVLTYRIVGIGTLSINLLFLIKTAIFIAVLILLLRLLQKFIVGRLLSRIHIAEAQRFALGRFITYAFFLIGVFVGVQSLGVNLNSLVIFGGAVGVGVGLGLQNVVSNFVAGLILLVEQPIRIGDRIEIKETMGDVIRIAARSTWVRTNDNVLIVVPNSDFINNATTNWTANDRTVRIQLPVGVGYASDPAQVRSLLLQVAKENKNVLDEPKADVIFTDYGDNSINFSLRVWTNTQTQIPAVLKSDLYFAAFDLFRKEGIELPFPQRDLHIRSSDIALPYQPETEPNEG